jgi:predicted protein tyrosine phosphatase
MNILFVCSRNKWRSATAETIFKNHPIHQVRSAGTEPSARIKLSAKLLNWADLIFVMERKHKQRIREKFAHQIEHAAIIVLDIPDEYQYMDEALIEELRAKVSDHL